MIKPDYNDDMNKPLILDIASGAELKRWYWTKLELQGKAKHEGLDATGAKFVLLDRIADKLDGIADNKPKSTARQSRFDWAKEDIHDDTVITDSYKSSQKVRAYMQAKIPSFKFNIDFMAWMKANTGKRMSDAVAYYVDLDQKMRSGAYVPEIKRHNQYNKYLRDFSKANPGLGLDSAKRCWKYKTSLPSADGMHAYEASDLKALS